MRGIFNLKVAVRVHVDMCDYKSCRVTNEMAFMMLTARGFERITTLGTNEPLLLACLNSSRNAPFVFSVLVFMNVIAIFILCIFTAPPPEKSGNMVVPNVHARLRSFRLCLSFDGKKNGSLTMTLITLRAETSWTLKQKIAKSATALRE